MLFDIYISFVSEKMANASYIGVKVTQTERALVVQCPDGKNFYYPLGRIGGFCLREHIPGNGKDAADPADGQLQLRSVNNFRGFRNGKFLNDPFAESEFDPDQRITIPYTLADDFDLTGDFDPDQRV